MSKYSLITLLQEATSYLKQKQVKNPDLSAQSLLAFVLCRKKDDLFLEPNISFQEKELEAFQVLIKKRAKKEPLDYLLGRLDFLGLELFVAPPVLIPRVETELLMEVVLKQIPPQKAVLWDLCTGSGCMGLSAKKMHPQLEVVLSDLSQEALFLARRNGKVNHLEVTYLKGDFLGPFKGKKANYILCNPPYVSEREYLCLEEEVYFEAKEALVAKDEGFEFYIRLAKELPSYLHPNAKIFLEIGAHQGKKVMEIFYESHWILKRCEKDFSGNDRFFFLEFAPKLS